MQKTAQALERERGWKLAGFKVGATSKAVQQRMGLTGPFWGVIYDSAKMTAPHRGGNIPRFSIREDLIRGVEAEFAFTIKKDIVPRSANKPYSAEELVTDYCSTVTPCVEVCGFRLQPDMGSMAPLIIADTGNTAVVFPGESFARNAADVFADLPSSKATISIDGDAVAVGSGTEVLGSPALSLEWFIKEAGLLNITIPQGCFVTTGATCGLVPITKSGYVQASFSGISKCDIHIAFRE
jgi:2-oxo-3-hexenedioate decarboxylase